MLHINILSKESKGGVLRDEAVLRAALSCTGFRVSVSRLRPPRLKRFTQLSRKVRVGQAKLTTFVRRKPLFDVNLFLERCWPEWLPHARWNCLIPNQEWFTKLEEETLPYCDFVLAKTLDAEAYFNNRGCRTVFIGFSSIDQFEDLGSKATDGLLHLGCSNSQKGTEALLSVWKKHLSWPPLTVVRAPQQLHHIQSPNVQHVGWLNDSDLRRYQNSFAIHLCPSEVEGFGHSIVEAMSCRSLVLTIDAPPMNELVTIDRGILVCYKQKVPFRSSYKYLADLDDLEEKIHQILAMTTQRQNRLSASARAWYEQNDKSFRERFLGFLQNLF